MGNHWKDLILWQKSHALVIKLYKILSLLLQNKKFVIIDQINRASVSIPTNIVEGQSKKDFARYLLISRGSLEEVRCLILLL